MSATLIVVEPVAEARAGTDAATGVAWMTGAGSWKAPSAQAPASAAVPPRSDAATSAASGRATDPIRRGRAAVSLSEGCTSKWGDERLIPPVIGSDP